MPRGKGGGEERQDFKDMLTTDDLPQNFLIKRGSTLRLSKAKSDTGRPPKSNTDKLVNEDRSITPSFVTPVSGIHNFSKIGMDVRCLIPASVIFEHLERSSSFKFVIPEENKSRAL